MGACMHGHGIAWERAWFCMGTHMDRMDVHTGLHGHGHGIAWVCNTPTVMHACCIADLSCKCCVCRGCRPALHVPQHGAHDGCQPDRDGAVREGADLGPDERGVRRPRQRRGRGQRTERLAFRRRRGRGEGVGHATLLLMGVEERGALRLKWRMAEALRYRSDVAGTPLARDLRRHKAMGREGLVGPRV
jgi:hypothetical protein